MFIREMKKDDLEEVVQLDEICFISPWDAKQFLYELEENPFAKVLLMVEGEKIIGMIDYWITFDIGQINQIAVLPSYQKQGIGSLLLKKALEDMFEKRVINVTLEVRYHNQKAISFYQSHGFTITLIKKSYYDNGDDAYYMERGMLDV